MSSSLFAYPHYSVGFTESVSVGGYNGSTISMHKDWGADTTLNDAWNSDLARTLIPDAIGFNANLTAMFIYGASPSGEFILPLRDQDSFRPTFLVTVSEGYGLPDYSANLGTSTYSWEGELKHFNNSTFLDENTLYSIGGHYLLGGSFGESSSASIHGTLYGVGVGLRVSLGTWTGITFKP